ncbi:MAG: acyltransferase, partial [Bacteroidaceae bacterium]|nr:acyltransferase [Bacteroidaceae bacterium]
GYIFMASMLPIREHIDKLTPAVFFDTLLLHPLGPYWYLQTLILCGFTYFAIFRIPKLSLHSRLIGLGLIFCVYAQWLHIISLSAGFYFLVGAIMQQTSLPFNKLFQPSPVALLAFTLLILSPINLSPIQVGGIFIVYSVICIGMLLTKHLRGEIREILLFIGRNTLPIFLFSPIFTLLSKHLLPLVSFDSSGILFIFVSLPVCLLGSFAIGWVIDSIHLSPLFFGKKKVLA